MIDVKEWLDRKFAAPARQKRFHELYIAEQPVDFSRIGEYRGEEFSDSGPYCWLDRPDALLEVERREKSGVLTQTQADICRKWIFEGYFIAEGLIDHATIDAAWQAYEKAVEAGAIELPADSAGPDDKLPGRKLDPHFQSPEILALQRDPRVLALTDLLFGRETLPFQTIMGHKGSWQGPHSDAIHMTTYPHGYLIANWIAFEDVHPDSGPLEFYPRSHRLIPLLLSRDIGLAPFAFKTNGGACVEAYEATMRRHVAASGLQPSYFLAKKGDVLFWHANLIHGGAPRKDLSLTRKALVCHYFARGAVTYHDLSGNPTRLHRNGMYEPPALD